MTETELIDRLIASKEYSELTALAPDFNLFDLLDDALREPAWSRIFSALLDSTLPHGLADQTAREWLASIHRETATNGLILPAAFRDLPDMSVFRTSCEYSTSA